MSVFCPLPWMHLSTHPAGYVTLCCEANHAELKSASYDITDPTIYDGQPSFYNVKFHKLNKVMNSDSFRASRLDILNGTIPGPCRGCFAKEDRGVESKRVRESRNFPHFTEQYARSMTNQTGEIDAQLEFVELRLGNTCNLRCVTCNPLSSSQWRKDYLQLSEKFDFLRDRYQMMDKDRFVTWPTGFTDSNVFEMDWPESQQFWDDLLSRSDKLKVIYINGGEPTLIKKHWEFLNKLQSSGLAKNIELNYSINGTNLPLFAIDTWKKFKKVRMSVSVDALNEQNAYIRYPCDWESLVKNIAKIKTSGSVEISITQTISAFNYDSLDKFYKYFSESGIYIHYNFVCDPAYYSPKIIPTGYRMKLHERYEKTLPSHLLSQLKAMYNDAAWDLKNLKKFKEVTVELDKIRGTNFEDTFPELYLWLK